MTSSGIKLWGQLFNILYIVNPVYFSITESAQLAEVGNHIEGKVLAGMADQENQGQRSRDIRRYTIQITTMGYKATGGGFTIVG